MWLSVIGPPPSLPFWAPTVSKAGNHTHTHTHTHPIHVHTPPTQGQELFLMAKGRLSCSSTVICVNTGIKWRAGNLSKSKEWDDRKQAKDWHFFQEADLQLKFTARCSVFNLMLPLSTDCSFWRQPGKARKTPAPASPEHSFLPVSFHQVGISSSQRRVPTLLLGERAPSDTCRAQELQHSNSPAPANSSGQTKASPR